jgi:hypothetical protein
LSIGSQLSLTEVTIVLGNGGRGGAGASGQNGGAHGKGADGGAASLIPPSKAGCPGGNGGDGGPGGPGGGGRGGHAIGIAYQQAPATLPVLKEFKNGAPGNGGSAADGAPMTSYGAKGNEGPCWNFTAKTACP